VGIAPTRERIPTPYKREAAASLNIAGRWPLDSSLEIRSWSHACYILCGTTSTSLGNPILPKVVRYSSKPIRKTNIDEHNFFRRRRLLQESPCNEARDIQRCQEMLADRPTNFQIGLTADVARVTKIRWPQLHVLEAINRIFCALAPEPDPTEFFGSRSAEDGTEIAAE